MLGRKRRLTLREKDEAFLPEFRPAAPFDPPPLDAEDLASCRDPLQRNLAIEFTVRLPGRVLFHADKLTMAHSLEARVPFLDRAIVEFAERLPSAMKVRSGQRKYVLAALARKHLPRRIARRRKQGLAYPQARLRSGPVAQALRGMLVEGSRTGGPFRREFLETRYDEWLKPGGPLFHRPLLFVFLQAWWDEFFAR